MKQIIVGLVLASSATGCIAVTATPAVHKKAYVVKGNMFGTSFWNCDASSGTPKCWQVKETEVAE
jgi:hypothetical protein